MYNYFTHNYSFAVTGLGKTVSKTFPSRYAANEYMYKMCQRHGLKIEEVWDDKHDKTYICNKGVTFYIHRI